MKIRAEDGRYVEKTNISGFIRDLPGKEQGYTKVGSRFYVADYSQCITYLRLVYLCAIEQQFSSLDASGSTSQASNIIEVGADRPEQTPSSD